MQTSLSTSGHTAAWTDANQQLLACEFARLRSLLGGEDPRATQEACEKARRQLEAPSAIDRLVTSFRLSAFERDLLLLCAGVELDGALASRCLDGCGASAGPKVTFGLALQVLPDAHWSAIAPVQPLRRWRLVDLDDEHAPATGRMAIDERVLHYLTGVNYLDPRLQPMLTRRAPPAIIARSHLQLVDELRRTLDGGSSSVVVQLTGDDRAGRRDVAALLSSGLGLELFAINAADIPVPAHEKDALALLWSREAVLLNAALLIDDATDTAASTSMVERCRGVIFLSASEPVALDRQAIRVVVRKPPPDEQKRMWMEALADAAARLEPAVDSVSAHFRLSADVIERTAASLRTASPPDSHGDALWDACRASARRGLETLADRIETDTGWDDLVLPEPTLSTLRQITAHVRHRLTVYGQWGFGRTGRGLGVTALFSGESGTGKTMAAEVIANDLRLDLYRIDLSSVVSKYIGETEKNLKRVFDAAEDSGAVLLFDEADALFGKRSDVKDSHDRYANIEVSYLLQRMEAYRGLAVLTTNLKHALDPAFLRRIRFVVAFPFPDADHRERIWRGMFPATTPLHGVDFAKLARLNVSGGHIRNIALNAAFLAADEKSAITMTHLLAASRSDAAKNERTLSDREVGSWV